MATKQAHFWLAAGLVSPPQYTDASTVSSLKDIFKDFLKDPWKLINTAGICPWKVLKDFPTGYLVI